MTPINMRKWLRNFIKNHFSLYDIDDLQIGGHCGCCGAWIPDEIFEIGQWASWGVCKECIKEGKKYAIGKEEVP